MNDWYDLTNSLDTDVPPLDEVTQDHIQKRVRSALPRCRKCRWLIAAIAAVLVLTACGYAMATGQFSDWFWTKADPQSPESSEDLLASIGTVIGQSQTVDGVTMTLNGALWDGETLMLSLTLEGGQLSADRWTDIETEDSWLRVSREHLKETWREYYPDISEADLDVMVDHYYEEAYSCRPDILYFYRRQTQTHVLQIQYHFFSMLDSVDLQLHLENLKFRDFSIQGPFDFSFTVEHRSPEVVYTGSAVLRQETGPAFRITKVALSPLWVKIDFELTEPMTEEELSSNWIFLSIGALHSGEQVTALSAAKSYTQYQRNADGMVSGVLACGPFHQVIDPFGVDAVELGSYLLNPDTFALTEIPDS